LFSWFVRFHRFLPFQTVNWSAVAFRGRGGHPPKPTISTAVDVAIEDQRGNLAAAITLVYCLHATLQCEAEEGGPDEEQAVKTASEWAELSTITRMLLVRLHSIHAALDSVSLIRARDLADQAVLIAPAQELPTNVDDREAP
jgi:hypothetical protein